MQALIPLGSIYEVAVAASTAGTGANAGEPLEITSGQGGPTGAGGYAYL